MVRIGCVRVCSVRIDCHERWITCTLTVQQAGIRGVPLDDTIGPLAARWDAIYGQLMLRLREVYRREPLSR